MIRLLFILSILFLIAWGIVSYCRYRLGRWLSSLQQKAQPKEVSQKLVKCAKCNTFIPAHQAYQTQEGYYCSKEHSKL